MTMPDDLFRTIIRYPRWEALFQQIQFCQQFSQTADEPYCLALEGMTGMGKSTLARRYAAHYPRRETPQGSRIPVIHVETPCPVTIKAVAVAMLAALGDPAATYHSSWAINTRLIHHLRGCAVELVILDDFHHLIDTDRDRVLKTVSEWLKVLIKETGIPFMVVAMPGSTARIFAANPQLSRLFHLREQLVPLSVAESDRFVGYAFQALQVTASEELGSAELARRVHYAADGVIGHCMGLLRLATFLAKERQAPSLALAHFAQAYQRYLARLFPRKVNPFLLTHCPVPFVIPGTGGE